MVARLNVREHKRPSLATSTRLLLDDDGLLSPAVRTRVEHASTPAARGSFARWQGPDEEGEGFNLSTAYFLLIQAISRAGAGVRCNGDVSGSLPDHRWRTFPCVGR